MDEDKANQARRRVQAWPRRAGKSDLLKHLNGEQLTRAQAIRAKCYECVGGEDIQPCDVTACPLTSFCQWNRAKKIETKHL